MNITLLSHEIVDRIIASNGDSKLNLAKMVERMIEREITSVTELQATIAELCTDSNAVTLAKSLAMQSIKFQKLQSEHVALRIKSGIEPSTGEDSCTYLSRSNA